MEIQVEVAKIILAFMVLINPFSALPIFLDLTQHYSRLERKKVARNAAIAVFVTIALFTISGTWILNIFGISTGAFRVSGGILVFLIAVSMMSGGSNMAKPSIGTSDEHDISIKPSAHDVTSIAVVPIAIPMMIGPGGISTVVIYTSTAHTLLDMGMVIMAGGIISLLCYVCLLAAARISVWLGEAGLNILNRVMGMLLAAVAVEIMMAGVKELLPTLLTIK